MYYKLELRYEIGVIDIKLPSFDAKVLQNQLKVFCKHLNKIQGYGFMNLKDYFDCDDYYVSNRNLFSARIYKFEEPVITATTPAAIKVPSKKKGA